MKKRLLGLALLICCFANISVYAEHGDVIGHIYSTDIRAYINGEEVPSYNIGGRTAVVVEDITTGYEYRDDFRTLIIDGPSAFAPYPLKGGASEGAAASGNIVGDIYETDIKTYIYDMELPSYNIGGKTAVVIEDLAGFKEYNDIGARYFYDDETRTIGLETTNDNWSEQLNAMIDHQINVQYSLSEDKSSIIAEYHLDDDIYSVGGNSEYSGELQAMLDGEEPFFLPVITTVNGEEKQLGYYLGHKTKRFDFIGIEMNGELLTSGYVVNEEEDDYREIYEIVERFPCFSSLDTDIINEAGAQFTIPELSARDKTIRDYLLHNVNKVNDRLDADDYSFLYMGFYGAPHGGSYQYLLRVDNDGNARNYADEFESVSLYGQKSFENVTIDKENEKVHFHYDKDYVIDLKTGEMTEE